MAVTLPHSDYRPGLGYLDSLLRSPSLLVDRVRRPLALPAGLGYWPLHATSRPDLFCSPLGMNHHTASLCKAEPVTSQPPASVSHESQLRMRSDSEFSCESRPASESDASDLCPSPALSDDSDKHVPPKLRHKALKARLRLQQPKLEPHSSDERISPALDDPLAPGPLRRPASLASLQAVKAFLTSRRTPEMTGCGGKERPQPRLTEPHCPYSRHSPSHARHIPSPRPRSPAPSQSCILDGILRGGGYNSWGSSDHAPSTPSPETCRPVSASNCPLNLSQSASTSPPAGLDSDAKQRTRDVLRQFRSIMSPNRCVRNATSPSDKGSVLRAILEGNDQEGTEARGEGRTEARSAASLYWREPSQLDQHALPEQFPLPPSIDHKDLLSRYGLYPPHTSLFWPKARADI